MSIKYFEKYIAIGCSPHSILLLLPFLGSQTVILPVGSLLNFTDSFGYWYIRALLLVCTYIDRLIRSKGLFHNQFHAR